MCGVQAVGTDHACFEGVDEKFEEGKAGGYDGAGDHHLAYEGGDPEVVDQVDVGFFCGDDLKIIDLENLGHHDTSESKTNPHRKRGGGRRHTRVSSSNTP